MTTTVSGTLNSLHARLDEAPDDWDTRLVLSDYLEENGDLPRAKTQRWMVEHQRCPTRPGQAWSERMYWDWW